MCNHASSMRRQNFIDFSIKKLPLQQIDTPCTIDHLTGDHLSHSIDLVTTLRSELAALTYKRDRLMNELTDTKGALCARDNECETLRVQSARQSALIISLQQRMQATETREKNLQVILFHFPHSSRTYRGSFFRYVASKPPTLFSARNDA